jgi:septal ring factor EnvC (AmiA/AmiB activator)
MACKCKKILTESKPWGDVHDGIPICACLRFFGFCLLVLSFYEREEAVHKLIRLKCESTLALFENTLTSFENTLASFENTLASFENTLASFENTLASFENTLASFENTLASRSDDGRSGKGCIAFNIVFANLPTQEQQEERQTYRSK